MPSANSSAICSAPATARSSWRRGRILPYMQNPLKVGVIGCGWFARAVHLPILRRLAEVELIALAEPDPDRRQEAGRCGPAAVVYHDYRDLLKKRDFDAVIVSV